jgi:hypothetical protein
MKEIFLHTHLGCGDMVNCNAIYRHYAKNYDLVHVFVKKRNARNIRFMLRDVKNIIFEEGVGDQDEFVEFYLMTHRGIPYVKIGFDYLKTPYEGKFVDLFYKQIGLDPAERFNGFYVERDLEAEERLCKIMNPSGEPYIFVHQDTARGHIMNLDHIKNKNIKIIESNYKLDDIKEYLIFHYLKLIEEAEEIHVMESGISPMIDCYFSDLKAAYLHKYMRGIDSVGRPYWNIIKER